MPDTGELVLADVISSIGSLTILVSLIESTFSLSLYEANEERVLSARLDRMAFKVVLGGFAGANAAALPAACD